MTYQRDLSCFGEAAICIADLDGTMLASSARHAARLGRSIDEVIGANWREWANPAEIARSEQQFHRARTGVVASAPVSASLPDGRVSTSRMTLMPTLIGGGRPAIMAVHTAIYLPTAPRLDDPSWAINRNPAFLATLMAELTSLAAKADLPGLADRMDELARRVAAE